MEQAVATLTESTAFAMGIVRRTSARRCASSVRPGPSAPMSTATRSGRSSARHSLMGTGAPTAASTSVDRADVDGVTSAQTTWPLALAASTISAMDPRRVKGMASAWPPETRIDFR